jgi:hypothetical protein
MNSRFPREIEVPASTAWPLVLAVGFTLICAGLLTSVSVSGLGAVLAVAGCAGWFREVLPSAHEVVVSVVPDDALQSRSAAWSTAFPLRPIRSARGCLCVRTPYPPV